jgi:hypothetical protein
MKKYLCLLFVLICINSQLFAQQTLDDLLPIRGLAIAAPRTKGLDDFIKFINEELGPKKVNTLILRVDYNYQFQSHPELRDSGALSQADVKKMVDACKKFNIRIIPQINLLGHQSWAGNSISALLRVYPEFDETPWIKMPYANYKWPNADGLYCKSYCPLHPGVHKVVFELIDEITTAFETNAFHAGMDEVFYIGEAKCPRCGGRDKAELFAGEIRTIRDHLALSNKELWIWGDRLIDGKTTGIGEWAASLNNTHKAIDLIPKDVIICDWQYGRPNQTAVYFALKGFKVVSCPWNRSNVAVVQVDDMIRSRKYATREVKPNFYGVVETVWSGPAPFLDGYYGRTPKMAKPNTNKPAAESDTPWNTFKVMFDKINKLETTP